MTIDDVKSGKVGVYDYLAEQAVKSGAKVTRQGNVIRVDKPD